MALSTAIYDLNHFPEVYEPSEDSFLFLDALEFELNCIKSIKPNMIMEIGIGSGIIITSLAKQIVNCVFFGIDINFDACKATKNTAILNNVSIEVCNTDSISHFKLNVFDIVLFNPPYVVTETNEIQGNGLSRAWAGGKNGREVIDKFLAIIPKILSSTGIFYILLIEENKPFDVVAIMNSYGFSYEIVKERRILGEYLYIFKFVRSNLV